MRCVFHSIRFKVIKVGATAVALFFAFFSKKQEKNRVKSRNMHFFLRFLKKSSQKIWWNQKIVVPLQPLKKTKL
ncbi:MAG: hypothetical protein EGS53_07260 [Prevotella sp.]|nr:hypothetical protein [Prevotella sp.]